MRSDMEIALAAEGRRSAGATFVTLPSAPAPGRTEGCPIVVAVAAPRAPCVTTVTDPHVMESTAAR